MENTLSQLRYKEIISIADGSRLGYVGDILMEMDTGRIIALVVLGRLRWFGLLGREEDRYIPWKSVHRFGEDTILVAQDSTILPLDGKIEQ